MKQGKFVSMVGALVVMIGALFVVTGCGDASEPNPIVGVWELNSTKRGEVELKYPVKNSGMKLHSYILFDSDGRAYMAAKVEGASDESQNGLFNDNTSVMPYSVSGNTASVNGVSFTFKIEGDVLTMTYTVSGNTMVDVYSRASSPTADEIKNAEKKDL